MSNLKIILVGATGQMGKTISNLVDTLDDVEIVYGVADDDGKNLSFPISEELPAKKIADVLVDFSTPKLLKDILNYGIFTNTPLVLATTGYSPEDLEKIGEASTVIPILQTGNMSVGVNVMEMVVETLSRVLEGYDIEIVEKHHKYKVDSPSGTAKMLFEAANRGRDNKLNALEGRAGFYEERLDTEVGISSIRGGNIVGEHSVIFAGVDEIIEIKHTANSKTIFANGAIRGAKFLADSPPGLYSMDDVLEISNE
ncbi:MAG: 4-hydroxy-tetrahydrodipicolinate reductase [Tissierellia bacterium]|nr:4-hydroxy-tetrahydrodipicolinate reductase [Tissierellia bacterium]